MQFENYPSFVQTSIQAGDTIGNTSAPTAFASKLTIPANSLTEGCVIYIFSGGTYDTPPVVTRSFEVGVLLGGSAILATGVRTPSLVSASSSPWVMRGNIILTLKGANGTAEGNGTWTFFDNVLGSDETWINATTASYVFDTTIDNDVQLYVDYTTADAANAMTMRHLNIYIGV